MELSVAVCVIPVWECTDDPLRIEASMVSEMALPNPAALIESEPYPATPTVSAAIKEVHLPSSSTSPEVEVTVDPTISASASSEMTLPTSTALKAMPPEPATPTTTERMLASSSGSPSEAGALDVSLSSTAF